jgi:hypothetical protein
MIIPTEEQIKLGVSACLDGPYDHEPDETLATLDCRWGKAHNSLREGAEQRRSDTTYRSLFRDSVGC